MFGNPWPSFRYSEVPVPPVYHDRSHPDSDRPPVGLRAYLPLELSYGNILTGRVRHPVLAVSARSPRIPNHIKSLIPNQIPTWGTQRGNEGGAKATWFG